MSVCVCVLNRGRRGGLLLLWTRSVQTTRVENYDSHFGFEHSLADTLLYFTLPFFLVFLVSWRCCVSRGKNVKNISLSAKQAAEENDDDVDDGRSSSRPKKCIFLSFFLELSGDRSLPRFRETETGTGALLFWLAKKSMSRCKIAFNDPLENEELRRRRRAIKGRNQFTLVSREIKSG